MCLAHPQVALKVLRVVGSRLRRLVGTLKNWFTTVPHRSGVLCCVSPRRKGGLPAQAWRSHCPPAIRNWRRILARGATRSPQPLAPASQEILQIDGRRVDEIVDLKALKA